MPGFIPRQLLDQYRPEDSDPTYRMSILPFGTYPNADGSGEHLGFAMPGMIQEPINALMRLGQNSRFEDGHLGIPNPQNLDNQHDTATLIESLFGGNATRGAGAAENAVAHALPEASTTGMRPGLTITRNGPEGASAAWHDIALDGNSIGKAYVREYPNTIQNSNFSIDPAYQRQGIGTEVQRALAERYGKPTVPDFTLSEAAYQRWLKNDPAAVADYRPWGPGSSQYSPGPLSDAYFAAQGGPPVPGTRAAAGELFSDTGHPSLFGAAVAGAERNVLDDPTDFAGSVKRAQEMFPDTTIHNRVYRGVSPFPEGPVGDLAGDRSRIFASTSPDVAGTYAPDVLDNGAVFPLDMAFKNAMTVDAQGAYWHEIPWNNKKLMTDEIADIASQRGYDGLVVRNVIDNRMMANPVGPADTYVALKRGTVKSPYTGETLFSDTGHPSLFGAAVADPYQDQDPRWNSLFNY